MLGATFLDFLWSLIIIFFMVIFFMILFQVIFDIFRRHDISGWGKAGWLIFVCVFLFLGVFIYLITQHDGMTQRQLDSAKAQQKEFNDYVQTVAKSSDPAEQIAKAKELLDAGTITQAEFDSIKAKALAS